MLITRIQFPVAFGPGLFQLINTVSGTLAHQALHAVGVIFAPLTRQTVYRLLVLPVGLRHPRGSPAVKRRAVAEHARVVPFTAGYQPGVQQQPEGGVANAIFLLEVRLGITPFFSGMGSAFAHGIAHIAPVAPKDTELRATLPLDRAAVIRKPLSIPIRHHPRHRYHASLLRIGEEHILGIHHKTLGADGTRTRHHP